MSSIAKVTVTSAPVTGRPFFVICSAKVFGAAALFGSTSSFSVYPSWCTTAATFPGPTFASAEPSSERYLDGGARLVSSAARENRRDDDQHLDRDERAQEREAAGASSGSLPAATSRGFVRTRLTRSQQHRRERAAPP